MVRDETGKTISFNAKLANNVSALVGRFSFYQLLQLSEEY